MIETIIAVFIGVFLATFAAAMSIYAIIWAASGRTLKHMYFGTSRAKALTEEENVDEQG